ncbi:MAG: hypothetical protein LUF68_01900 [Clostridiales bacterium]|nr:hypothetical protein [Clostridiales bacterium]
MARYTGFYNRPGVKFDVVKQEDGQYVYRMTKPIRFCEQTENGISQMPYTTDATEATLKAYDEIPGKGRFCV